jgi:hypothetical protein
MKKRDYRRINIWIGFCIVMIFLKLTNGIDADWVWVLAPFWIPIAMALFITLLLIIKIIIGGNK